MAKILDIFKKQKVVTVLLFAVIILGNYLRTFAYASVPIPGEVADEYSFGWLGLSLLKDHYPIAWSGLPGYKNHSFQKIDVDNIFTNDPNRPAFSIDKPWFDHPPFLGLVTGGYAYFKGVREFKDASVGILRRPMLKIALVTSILIFVLTYLLFDRKVAFLATFLYNVIPTAVISSRLALAENMIIPLSLLVFIFVVLYFKHQEYKYWFWAAFFACLAMLFKLSAVYLFLALLTLVFSFPKRKRKRLFLPVFAGVLISLGLFGIYGAIFDFKTFIAVLMSNAGRFYGAGSEVFLQAVSQFKITAEKFLTDGWILVGWISFFLIAFQNKSKNFKKFFPNLLIRTAVFSYLIIFLLFGSESYGWYKFPFLPFLLISLAKIAYEIYLKKDLVIYFCLILFPFGSSLHRLIGSVGFQKYVPFFRVFVIIIFILYFIGFLKISKIKILVIKLLFILTIIFLAFLSVWEILFYNLSNWYFVT